MELVQFCYETCSDSFDALMLNTGNALLLALIEQKLSEMARSSCSDCVYSALPTPDLCKRIFLHSFIYFCCCGSD